MRVKVFSQLGGAVSGINNGPTGTMTGPLYLAGNPASPLEAVTKKYVDDSILSLSASSLKKSILSANMLPAFTGDLVSATGSGSFTLVDSGIVAGTYAKVTVNAKGIIVNSGLLVNNDIPPFSWGKIVKDKPTTLSGYGITDSLGLAGGTLNGVISLTKDPTTALGAANKQYADAASGGSTGVSIGTVMARPTSTTPSGFFRANGGEVSQTTYSALYAIIGDTYSFPLVPGSGKPWAQQYNINTTQSGDIVEWARGTDIPVGLAYSQAVVTKSRVYLLGGWTSSGNTSVTYTAPINSDGTLGAWTTGTPLSSLIAYSQAIVTKNRVYLLGGDNNGSVSTVCTAPINTDGTLGTWATGTSLPGALAYSQAVVTKNRVYLLGGINNSVVYTAPINTDGTLGTWTTGTPLPASFGYSQVVMTKNRVYLLGGHNGATIGTVYTAPINTDGTLGTWSAGTALAAPIYATQALVTKNRVYLIGGSNGLSVSAVYTAPINADGTLGAWTTGTSLPAGLFASQVIATKNHIYMLGGYNGSQQSLVYTATISGSLNDYSSYYDGTYVPTTTGNFRVPDLSLVETASKFYYIKY